MQSRNLVVTAAVVAAILAVGGTSFARGGAGGAGMGAGLGSQYRGQSVPHATTQVRPEGSQRRDGTFLTTGTTANGSTTRPANGRGVMDGTGINAAPSTTTAQ